MQHFDLYFTVKLTFMFTIGATGLYLVAKLSLVIMILMSEIEQSKNGGHIL